MNHKISKNMLTEENLDAVSGGAPELGRRTKYYCEKCKQVFDSKELYEMNLPWHLDSLDAPSYGIETSPDYSLYRVNESDNPL